jgi:hypothetical protein
MALALGATAIVLLALACELAAPRLRRTAGELWRRRRRGERPRFDYDPGRELRAEQRARALLRSCVNDEEWEMYRDLGFLRVWGAGEGAYLIYPHRPIVAYAPKTGTPLGEYCVTFPDSTRPYGSARLPDSDDVLAKWITLSADEQGLIAGANMHLPGRQVSLALLRRDLARLARWERERIERDRRDADSVPAL